MKQFAWVALGGALGAMMRYALSGWVQQALQSAQRFPSGTFVVNVLGCFAVGCITALLWRHASADPAWRLFLVTGVLGGFTTYSAFGLETVLLLKRGDVLMALLYVVATLICGVLAVVLGMAMMGGWSAR